MIEFERGTDYDFNSRSAQISLMASLGYAYHDRSEGEDMEFIRAIDQTKPYPRFHLRLFGENGRIKMTLHIDKRKHRVDVSSGKVFMELERMSEGAKEVLGRVGENSRGLQEIQNAIMYERMFGVVERLNVSRRRVVVDKKG